MLDKRWHEPILRTGGPSTVDAPLPSIGPVLDTWLDSDLIPGLLEIVEFWIFFLANLFSIKKEAYTKIFEARRCLHRRVFLPKTPWNYRVGKVLLKSILFQNVIFYLVKCRYFIHPNRSDRGCSINGTFLMDIIDRINRYFGAIFGGAIEFSTFYKMKKKILEKKRIFKGTLPTL